MNRIGKAFAARIRKGKRMDIQRCQKDAFAVIGRLGSTDDGEGFIQRLWAEANAHFDEVRRLAKCDEGGELCGIWGAMSDGSGSLQPWEDGFTKGLYLAGVECKLDKKPPEGWTKWLIPACEYLVAENTRPDTFPQMIAYLEENSLSLAGAVHDFTCPKTGKSYMYFPIRFL